MLAIAAGFVLRAFAGGVATDIYLSRWFVIVTGCCAIFLVAAKRYAELREQGGRAPARATLRRYSLGRLRLRVARRPRRWLAWPTSAGRSRGRLTSCGTACRSCRSWRGSRATRSLIGAGAGEAPEELILRDRTLLALSVVWGVLFVGGVYVGR